MTALSKGNSLGISETVCNNFAVLINVIIYELAGHSVDTGGGGGGVVANVA
jgi:hypothetical protein